MIRICYSFTVFTLLSIYILSCSSPASSVPTKEFLSLKDMDPAVKPGNDFYLYANGGWLKTAVIPPTESGVGAFLDIYNRTKAHLKEILDTVSKLKNPEGSIEQKVGDFYTSGLDSATIEKLGYDPIKPFLQKIDSIKDVKAVLQFVAEQTTIGRPLLIAQYIGADEKNSSMNIAVFGQGGLGLPDRDYYFKTDAATKNVVNAYQAYLSKLFQLTGDDPATAAKNVMNVYELEKKFAASHRTNVELRDPQSNYNKMAVADLDAKMPLIGWKQLLHYLSIETDSVNVGQPAYYAAVNDQMKKTTLETWKTYLRAHLINNSANALSSDFVNASFDYYGKALRGQQQIKERWERIYRSTDANLGEALGQLYVKKYFTEDAKNRMLELVNNLQQAFETRINNLDWMTDSTKTKAKEKLHVFIKKIGFPDKWRDYSKVSIDKSRYYENLLSAGKNEYNFQVGKVGKPVDKTEWGMTPPTINAYYNPTFNEIVFPAGILQLPFFDLGADDAINYGGIGMVIGHEMTHGFDDQGAQYDKDGNLKNWWSPQDNEKFQAKGTLVANLYSTFIVLDSMKINGRLTLGENMADIGGIAIAYDAFKMTKQGKDTVKIDGFTPDQRFFLSFAQEWKEKTKDESLRQQVNTDPHSTSKYRVLGPLMNFTPFYTAFNVVQGDKMWKPENERIKIW
ncbi:MAG: M13 family metallopeptidase [Chitinophagaceae bacterium]